MSHVTTQESKGETSARGPRSRSLVPGLALVGAGLLASTAINSIVPAIGVPVAAVMLGALLVNLRFVPDTTRPGLEFAAKRMLRAGVVLMGLQLAIPDVLALGAPTLLLVTTVVLLTFVGTRWFGRLAGLSPGASLLLATGTAICGASAIVAMDGVTDNEEEDVVTALAMVTLFGSLAIVVLPLVRVPLGLSPEQFGILVGASVHEVAQVVATAAVVPGAVAVAAIVKLARVVTLAPMVAGMSVVRRTRGAGVGRTRPPMVPLFVVGFLACIAVRTTGVLPAEILRTAKIVDSYLLAAALFGLGTGVRFAALRRLGVRAVGVGLAASLLAFITAYAGVLVVT
ncbi:YeiH family protein [Actinopolymorpha alba]|uniref:YeiH family protein n=1 Tax=Actinopolymorpha alba TaxID=533267 RepID=UPI0003691D4F|nr:putative sulfate exporter family transporter [Actinopolymorpha alba]